jgi:hypothetical protein
LLAPSPRAVKQELVSIWFLAFLFRFGPAVCPPRLRVVLSRDEMRRAAEVVEGAEGVSQGRAELLYRVGLRRRECRGRRVKAIDLDLLDEWTHYDGKPLRPVATG